MNSDLSMAFKDKTVVITGAGTGIGQQTAGAFLERGANVVLNGRRELKLQEAITELDPTGKHVAYLAGDIGKPETARQLVRTAVQRCRHPCKQRRYLQADAVS